MKTMRQAMSELLRELDANVPQVSALRDRIDAEDFPTPREVADARYTLAHTRPEGDLFHA